MTSAKTHIRQIVEEYIKTFPIEWRDFKKGMSAVRAMASDEEFATLDGTKDTRALYEMPETLQTMLIMKLEEDEMLWLKAGNAANRNEGGHWFAKTFKEFAIPKEI